jgi:hypothetical protein
MLKLYARNEHAFVVIYSIVRTAVGLGFQKGL